jgi:hypothetical protein
MANGEEKRRRDAAYRKGFADGIAAASASASIQPAPKSGATMIRWILCKIGIHSYPRHGGISPPGHRYPRFGACLCWKIHPENIGR